MSISAETATDKIADLFDLIKEIEETLDAKGLDKAADFLESVSDGLHGVEDTITRTQRVSNGQWRAIANWERGLRRWLPG